MSAEVKKEIQLEIGHVLFIDIIGYSNLLITAQSELLRRLSEIVRETEQFRAAASHLPLVECLARHIRFSDEAHPILGASWKR